MNRSSNINMIPLMHPGTRYLKDLVFETEITKWYSSDFLLLFYKIITLFINVNELPLSKIIKIDYFYDIEFFLQISNKNSGNAKKSRKITIIVIKKP